MNITKYFFFRLIAFFFQILGAIAVIISATSIIAYDPTIYFIVGDSDDGNIDRTGRSESEIAQFKEDLGLEDPPLTRFLEFVDGLFTRGDLGNSWFGSKEPVSDLYLSAFVTTLKVFGLGILIFSILAIIFGILAARDYNGRFDKNIRFSTSIFYSMPSFVLGTLLIFLTQNFLFQGFKDQFKEYISDEFSTKTLVDFNEYYSLFIDNLGFSLIYRVLPIITVVLIYTGFQFRLVRIYMLEVLNQNYIRTAHAKGLHEHSILLKHGLRNALPELITSVAITFPVAISGVVVLEKVFSIAGSGLLLIESGLKFNWPVLIGGAVIFTALNALMLAITDIIVHLVNPQLRFKN